MSYRDYIHCSTCDYKLIYDGSDTVRDNFVDQYGEDYKILCPDCLKKLLTQLSPDPLSLLKRCRLWIEHERDYYKNKGDASSESATKANAMISAAELDTLLSDLAKAGVK